MELEILFNDQEAKEGDIVKLNGVDVYIYHITTTGFLYNKQSNDNDYVRVKVDGHSSDYYKNWDYLDFIKCEVRMSEK